MKHNSISTLHASADFLSLKWLTAVCQILANMAGPVQVKREDLFARVLLSTEEYYAMVSGKLFFSHYYETKLKMNIPHENRSVIKKFLLDA